MRQEKAMRLTDASKAFLFLSLKQLYSMLVQSRFNLKGFRPSITHSMSLSSVTLANGLMFSGSLR
jgi:hypothetical protein